MSRGIKMNLEFDLANTACWVVDFLEDEFDRESVAFTHTFNFYDDAKKAGRHWMNHKINSQQEAELFVSNNITNSTILV